MPWGSCGIAYFWRLVPLFGGDTIDLAIYTQQQNDVGGIWYHPFQPHLIAQNPPNASYIIAGGRGKWRHSSLLSNHTLHHRVQLDGFSVLIFRHYLGCGLKNNAYPHQNIVPNNKLYINGEWWYRGIIWEALVCPQMGRDCSFYFAFFHPLSH